MKKILIPIDFSDCSNNALEFGINMAKPVKAKILLMHAHGISLPGITETLSELKRKMEEEEAVIRKKLEKIQERIANQNSLECEYIIIEGSPGSSILQIAGEQKPDLIVMGTIGKKGWSNFLGSTASAVIKNSEFPVLVIPVNAHKKF